MHPRSRQWHFIDYVIVRRTYLKEVLITRTMRGAEGWTDHRLICLIIYLCYKPPHRAKHKIPTWLVFTNPSTSVILQENFHAEFRGEMLNAESSIDEHCHSLAQSIHKVCQQVVGKQEKKNQDWFDITNREIMKSSLNQGI